MNLISMILKQLLIIIITIIGIDVVGISFFKDTIKENFFPHYGSEKNNIVWGYPRHYFKSDSLIGFDIKENTHAITKVHPPEYGPYPIWGNSYGCFDNEWTEKKLINKNLIYLAGDSVTWGYAKFENKFGTLLENQLSVPVLKCGVTHTGQMHQFIKFQRLYNDSKINPSVVIVNFVPNDLNNDYFFPHSDVIEGYMIENIQMCNKESKAEWSKIPRQQLETEIEAKLAIYNNNLSIRNLMKKYSLTANVVAGLTSKFRNNYHHSQFDTVSVGKCMRNLDIKALGFNPNSYDTSEITKNNKAVMKNWASHAKKNNYKLIYSFFRDNSQYGREISSNVLKYARSIDGILVWDFEEFSSTKIDDTSALYHKFDGHFSDYGNSLYAEFLEEMIKANDLLK